MALVYLTSLILCLGSAAQTRNKLFLIGGGRTPSCLYASKPGAWSDRKHGLPAQFEGAIKRSRILIFAEPTWDKVAMQFKFVLRDRSVFTTGDGVIAKLPDRARSAFVKLTPPTHREALEGSRPGIIYSIVEQNLRMLAEDELLAPEGDGLDDGTTDLIIEYARSLFGRPMTIAELRERYRELKYHARARRVPFDQAIHDAGRDATLKIETLMRYESTPNVWDQFDRFITERDLQRGLERMGTMAENIEAQREVDRVKALTILPELIDAEYLQVRNDSVLRVLNEDPHRQMPGREKLNLYQRSRHQFWMKPLVERFTEGGVFAALPLEHVIGSEEGIVPGLQKLLVEAGFSVVPIEVGCGRYLQ